jgi:hypothetical protein
VTSGRRDKQIQVPESKQLFRRTPVKLARMSAARMPARMCRPGKEHARPVVAGIIVLPGISSRAPDMRCSSKAQVSRDIGKMMEIPPLRGWDINNSSSSSTSKASSMSSTSRSSSGKK